MDVTNLPLVRYIARQQKPVILSTGMATLGEIELAVRAIENEGNRQIVLLHCISIYPPAYEDIHLNNIPMLAQAFGYPVGFSDHTIGTSIPLASVALGSCIIEKHFTLDKDLPGWDHEISADPNEMTVIVQESKNIIRSLGGFTRIVSAAEEEKKKKFRRSIVAKHPLQKGTVLREEDIDYKRPGTHIAPDETKYITGRKLNRDIAADELLDWSDFV
jgi:N-acetylneuraminate synthase